MARAGAVVRIRNDGELEISRGLVHPDDVKVESKQAVQGEAAPREVAAIPASVVKDLSAHRTAALRLAMAENPQVALAATVHALTLPLVNGREYNSCLEISRKNLNMAKEVAVRADCSAHDAMQAHAEYWGERLPNNPVELFGWCLEQPQDVLLSLLAYCTALSVNALKDKFDREDSARLLHADALAESLALDMAACWQPSVKGFYGRLSKSGLLMIAKDAGAELSLVIGNAKKLEAAQDVMEAVSKTAWLPPVLHGKPVAQATEGEGA